MNALTKHSRFLAIRFLSIKFLRHPFRSFSNRAIFSTLFAFSILTGAVSAQDESSKEAPATEEKSSRSNPVVVTARRRAADPFDEPVTASILHRIDLDHKLARTIPEALRDIPGVMIQKTSHGQGSPYLRGFTSFRTVLLIDGIRLNHSVFRSGPNQYWATVDPGTLERIEVVKGPTSVLYGSDAIGGTVQLLSRKRTDFELDLDWDGVFSSRASEAERSVQARNRFEGNVGSQFGYVAGYSFRHSGDVRQGSGSVQDMTGYWEQAGDIKLQFRPNPETEITFAHQEFDQNDVWRTHKTVQGTPFHGTSFGSDRMRKFDQDRSLTYLQVNHEGQRFYDRLRASLSFHFQGEEEKRIRSNGNRIRQGFEVRTTGLWLQLESDSPIGVLTYGIDWYHDQVDSFRRDFDALGGLTSKRIQGPVADEATYDTFGLFIQDEIDLGDRLLLILGTRYTQVWADADEVSDPVTGNEISLSKTWPSFVGSARLLYRAHENWHLFGGLNQGFRAPNLSDLTRFDSSRSGETETPSPNLDPEYYLTSEIGLKTRHDSLETQVGYYYTRIWDMILRSPTGNLVDGDSEVTKSNAGDGFVHGVEAEIAWNFAPGWRMAGQASWQESLVEQFSTSDPVLSKDNLDRMQPLSGGLSLRWTNPKKNAWAEVSARFARRQNRLSPRDELDTDRIVRKGTPGYGVIDLRGGWKATKNLTVTGAIENLTDANYRILGSGQQEPGINALIGLEIRY